jgi:hypothetical protein
MCSSSTAPRQLGKLTYGSILLHILIHSSLGGRDRHTVTSFLHRIWQTRNWQHIQYIWMVHINKCTASCQTLNKYRLTGCIELHTFPVTRHRQTSPKEVEKSTRLQHARSKFSKKYVLLNVTDMNGDVEEQWHPQDSRENPSWSAAYNRSCCVGFLSEQLLHRVLTKSVETSMKNQKLL